MGTAGGSWKGDRDREVTTASPAESQCLGRNKTPTRGFHRETVKSSLDSEVRGTNESRGTETPTCAHGAGSAPLGGTPPPPWPVFPRGLCLRQPSRWTASREPDRLITMQVSSLGSVNVT